MLKNKIYEDEITKEELEEYFKIFKQDKNVENIESGTYIQIFDRITYYFYKGRIVPEWLYKTPAEELTPDDYYKCEYDEEKIAFVDKVGYQKLIKFGTVVDSYKNYPDNEIWTKSEYQIIDMSFLPCYTSAKYKYHLEPQLFCVGNANYAPFLYMKNQTTGAYHLEGLHPRCRTLYDAIRMRYNGLNIQDYDIKDIK